MPSKNLAISVVATAPSPATSGTSLIVTSGHGSRFPTVPFKALIYPGGYAPDPSNSEVVLVTAVSTDTLTITRAQEGSSARTVVVGDQIAATVTAAMWDDVSLKSEFADWFRKSPFYVNDFNRWDQTPGGTEFWGGAIASGTLIAGSTPDQHHPGQATYRSSTTANSGYNVGWRPASSGGTHRFGGGQVCDIIFKPLVFTNTTTRLGFIDGTDQSAPEDGFYLEINTSGTGTGMTANNSTRSSTGTTYSLSINTWYRLRIIVAADNSRVDFYLYDDSGTQLWTNGLTTNIPTSSRDCNFGVKSTNSGTTATDLITLDYMAVWWNKALTR